MSAIARTLRRLALVTAGATLASTLALFGLGEALGVVVPIVNAALLIGATTLLGAVWALRRHVRGAGGRTPVSVSAGLVPSVACAIFLVPRFVTAAPEPALLTLASVLLLAAPIERAWARHVSPTPDGPASLALFALSAPLAAALGAASSLSHPAARVGLIALVAVVSLALALTIVARERATAREVEAFVDYLARIQVTPHSVLRPVPPVLRDEGLRALEAEVRQKSEALARDAESDARARGQIADARELRTRFMAAMSHELRSPLNSIVGFAHILERGLDGALTEGQRESVTMVRRSAEELILLLTDVLDLARLEAGKLVLRCEWTPSVEILTEAVGRGRSIVEGRDVEIVAELQPGLPPVHADRRRIVQAVVALFRHAASSLRRTTIRLRTRIALGPPGPERHLRVEIHDALGAIPQHEVEKIFEAFKEISEPSGRRVGGLGMALSLSRALVRLHGGDVWAETFPGAGTILCVALPLEPPEPKSPMALRTGEP